MAVMGKSNPTRKMKLRFVYLLVFENPILKDRSKCDNRVKVYTSNPSTEETETGGS